MSHLAVLKNCTQTQKQLTTLNNFWVLLKNVLIDLCAHNFVQAKTSLHARCMHACHRVHNLSNPGPHLIPRIYTFQICYILDSEVLLSSCMSIKTGLFSFWFLLYDYSDFRYYRSLMYYGKLKKKCEKIKTN